MGAIAMGFLAVTVGLLVLILGLIVWGAYVAVRAQDYRRGR